MKRVFDILASATALLLLAPVICVLAVLIRLDSPGPSFFRQVRIGRLGRPFTLLKFRSMHTLDGAEDGRFDVGSVARVTRLGAFLRRSKLDEIPQLINVLRGDMSLVGPRPEVETWTRVHPERWRTVLTVRPGITDRASIAFVDEETLLRESDDPDDLYRTTVLPRKLELAEEYVRTRSFLGDLRILAATALAIVARPPARSSRARRTDSDQAIA
jgi:lipopolysaccharide/colanic/teichoic acid biosynthesis glycosyltransferase